MSTFKNVEEAREYFKKDKFATNSGILVEKLGEDSCVCSMEINENHINAIGGVMGGAIFTVADLAFSAVINNIHLPSVAIQTSVNFISGVKGTKLFASAKCVKSGRTTTICNVDVTDDTGRLIAQFSGTGFKL
ncbi:MAG: PaaI family thioesterase [Ruminococcus sp.]|nr:PaaI family thioesterase [Ruminococcus sp.]